jgi:hypothetical protein
LIVIGERFFARSDRLNEPMQSRTVGPAALIVVCSVVSSCVKFALQKAECYLL